MQASKEALLWMYEKMVEIRNYEETMANVYLEGKLPPQIQKGLAFDIGSGPRARRNASGCRPGARRGGVCAHSEDRGHPWWGPIDRTTSPLRRVCRWTG